MNLKIEHQDSYSRGQLLLRTIFGAIYIAIPHMFLLMFIGIWSSLLGFLAFWAVLFTGKYPKGFFDFQIKYLNWYLRVEARMYNLSDGYPAFGLDSDDDSVSLDVTYPDSLSRGLVLLRAFFGAIYVMIPHGFCLYFRAIWTCVLMFFAWWAVLFTGKYPAKWHAFNVGTIRWGINLSLYMGLYTDDYPKFSGKE